MTGWRRSLLALGLGVVAAAALPPAHVLPLLVVAFTGLTWLTAASRSPWRAFLAGWWFGFGHFLTSIYWIGAALLTDPEQFGWMVGPAVIGLSAGFALFPAVAALVVRASGLRGIARVLAFAAAWTALEWLRGHMLTGFPWNLVGSAWTISEHMIQLAALTGAYGLSLVTVIVGAMPAVLAEPGAAASNQAARRWALGAAALLLLAVWAGGAARMTLNGDAEPTNIRLRIVQANIAQDLKWLPGERDRVLASHLRLTAADGYHRASHVIWPEAAVPFFLADDEARRILVSAAAPANGLLITGAPRRSVDGGGELALWNSLHALDDQGRIQGSYDKHHLVPFGEYVPFRSVLSLAKLAYGAIDYSPGPGPKTLHLPGLPPVGPLICYEAIFPGQVVDRADPPQWLLNVTNDGWFGVTAGPYQHFQSARLRAVEQGLPLVRAANTGISAVIDAHGRIVARLGLGVSGVLDALLPTPLSGATLYARAGDWIIAALLAVIVLALGVTRWRVSR
jgi:apolipoprotein N-acyltransferase